MAKPVEKLDRVVIRFAGDSGDGMQLTGSRFTSETAVLGNDASGVVGSLFVTRSCLLRLR